MLQEISEILRENPKVEDTSARVRFLRFAECALEIEIYCYILEGQYEEYLATQEELLLTIMDAKEEAGAVVALPTQTTFVTQDRWIDPEKAKAAKAAIEKNRNPGVPGPSKMPVGSQGERRVIERECFTPRFSWNQTLSRTTHALVKTDPAHPT